MLLAGCAGMLPTPEQRQAIAHNAARRVTCEDAADCELRWAQALEWVQRNSHWKLRTVTDSLITTEGPLDTIFPAFEITKFPLGQGRYEIRLRAGCGAIFGCYPDLDTLRADFNVSLMGSERPKVAPAPAPAPAAPAVAQQPAPARDSVAEAAQLAAAKVVATGQTAAQVRAAIGRDPDSRSWSRSARDGGEAWIYRFPAETVTIWLIDGVVSHVTIEKRRQGPE